MPNYRSDRNKIILNNALGGYGKLACARRLNFDNEPNKDDLMHDQQMHEGISRKPFENGDKEETNFYKGSSNKKIYDIQIEKESNISKELEEYLLFEENAYTKVRNTEEMFAEVQDEIMKNLPANKQLETIDVTEKIVANIEKDLPSEESTYENVQNTHVVSIEVHDEPTISIPASKRIKVIDVQIVKASEKMSRNDEIVAEKTTQDCGLECNDDISDAIIESPPREEHKIEQEVPEIFMDSELLQEDATIKNAVSESKTQDTRKRRTSERKPKVFAKKCYLDFVSDEDVPEYVWDSSSWEGSDTSSSESGQDKTAEKTKSKRKKSKPQKVTCEEDGLVGQRGLKREKTLSTKIKRSIARKMGESYETSGGRKFPAKEMKPNPCINAKKCFYKCYDITEEKRKNLFVHFNGLSLQRKRDWLVAMTLKELPKRKRNKDAKRREYSHLYFINDGEGRRQVCLRFLLSTLDVTQKFVHYTLSNSINGSAQEDLRGKAIPPNKTKSDTLQSVKQFIMNLPAVPSHYCRKDSTRVYLPSEMKNITNVYEKYKIKQQNDGIDYVGEKVFRKIFSNDFNIGFHVPKKDKCQKCVAYNDLIKMNVLDDKAKIEKEKHDQESRACDQRFKFHKSIRLRDKHTLCVSFDMQKVLNTPMGENMLLFYSRKYAVYNLTFYESITRNGYCFTWGESDGKRGANEIATILVKYVEEVDRRNEAQCLLLYSDSCPGQNKNKTVLAALHHTLQRCNNITTIQVNFLLPGHTMMPVDSMHAVIENSITATVWAPSQWATVFQLARKNYAAYNVSVMHHTDFLGYDKMSDKYFRGNLSGKISKLTSVTMKKNKPVKVKYTMQQEAQAESIEVVGSSKQLQPIYKSRLPISEKKYADLMQLCEKNIIPRVYHAEYQQLLSKKMPEALMESDEEDEDLTI